MADIILPGAAYTEKKATYANLEGRAQRTLPAVAPPGSGREDWAVLRAISEVAGCALPYDDVEALRRRIAQIAPSLVEVNRVQTCDATTLLLAAKVAQVYIYLYFIPIR